MKADGKHILTQFLRRWQWRSALEVMLFGIGAGVGLYGITDRVLMGVGAFIGIILIVLIYKKPWETNLKTTSSYLDMKLDALEYSTGLFLKPQTELSNLAKLQQVKIAEELQVAIKHIQPPIQLLKAVVIAGILIGFGFLGRQFGLLNTFGVSGPPSVEEAMIPFHTQDTTLVAVIVPQLVTQRVIMRYPKYTTIGTQTTAVMDIKALIGTRVTWQLEYDQEVKSVSLQSTAKDYPMTLEKNTYTKSITLSNSGFYNFKFEALDGAVYTSDLYSIEVVQDEEPTIEIKNLEQFTSFDFDASKTVNFNAKITDDYGIAQAHIIATVSKGSGESVKFREEQLPFDTALIKGSKTTTLPKQIDLDQLALEPGDELYFYVEASDYKTPTPNISRSETYFATIKDTVSYEFGVEGTLGVDRLADYFRSQRQLIIDTEKLIRQRKTLSIKDFQFKSNELGYDQKSLRLKYGAFMGEESEEVTTGGPIAGEETDHHEEETDDHDEDDPLAKYTHDHDGDNEHNLVGNEAKKKETTKNPLQEFIHDHGDPESATLFEESLKVKLLKALSEMWDAELHLRLYEPEQSLPYQYEALKYIQEIKNSARIYVHRIGFDPPPIKEDKRLSGKLDEVSSYRKKETITEEEQVPAIKAMIERLETILENGSVPTEQDIKLFEAAGNELAVKAIEAPGKYLMTLQQLQRIVDGSDRSKDTFIEVQQGLRLAVPKPVSSPHKSTSNLDTLNQLLLKELEVHE
mgnify:CR=1 FL=1